MKLTLKRDLPLLLAALLVIWGLWYARPIGVDTLFPGLEPDLVYGSGAPLSTWWCRPSPSWKGSWIPTSNTRKPMI